jgi:hypothetical protein
VDDIDKLNNMLTIKNILKLQNQPIWDGWEVNDIYKGDHNDTYIFELVKRKPLPMHNGLCTIMLERTGHTHSDKLVYFFIYNSQRTDVCATADWLADKDNMIAKLEYILVNKENL